ncbi:taperin [Chiroxiphia lanceolata]|uniref:taperin n=1 Tax=Chiroxiphia lanceolata TaxID=296741 RepID=UPI0013CF18BE|nr:taperin [Chiroxiphia lanceolata]
MSSAEPPLGAGPRAQPAWQREILERKRAKLAGAGGEPEPPAGERLVVAESLGPLRENPFMRLESERRRLRQGRPGPGAAARPLQQLLELYSAVPGIRTIRADNILIIESRTDPAACFAAGDAPPARRRDPAGPDPLRELLARRGAALAEIRADQVVIYETGEPPEPPEAAEPGTVSRLLEKFGQRPRGRRRRGGDALSGTGAGGAAAPPQVGPGAARAAGPGSPRAPAPLHKGPGSPRAPAPKAAPASPPAVRAAPQPAPPRAATPPAVPAAPQPAVLQPVSPRAATPQPTAPSRAVAPQPLPAPPRAVTPEPAAPPRAVTPQPVPPQAALAPPRAVTPQPATPARAVAPQPAVSPRAVTPEPAAPQPAPAAPRAAAPQAVPAAPKAAAPQANCFLHKISSNSFTVTPRGQPPGARVPEPGAVPAGRPAPPKGPPVPSASPSHARANARRPKPEEAEAAVSPLPSASLAPSATGATQPLSASAPRAGGSFEIHPAPKPDLAAIPAHDLQAQALAKLRLNSRNSFLFVPRREGGPARPPAHIARPGPPPPPSEEKAAKEPPRAPAPEQEEPAASPPAPLDPLVPVTYIDDIVEPDNGEVSPRAGSTARTGSLDQPGGAGPDLEMEFSSVPLYRPHSAPHQRGGSTFTVVPKRKPVASGLQTLTDASGRPQREEEDEEEESKGRGKAMENADGPQVGIPHKKRYPSVNEIEVIGGYLSLERSCMSKTGSRRKKMKISFNETSLQTMFEYPSESSLAEEEEEEEEGHASETEEEKSCPFYVPRPNGTLHPSTPSSADLSSYTPKHSVKFSEWQEQKYEGPAAEGPLPKEADSHGNQDMLTPAEKGGLSDFSSEPALYF